MSQIIVYFARYECAVHASLASGFSKQIVLQAIMTEYRYGEDAFIPPTSLRRALSVLYKDLERFQLGKIVRQGRDVEGCFLIDFAIV